MNAQGIPIHGGKSSTAPYTLNKADITYGYDRSVRDYGGGEEAVRSQLSNCGDFLNNQI